MRQVLFSILLMASCPMSWSATNHSDIIQKLENSLEHKDDYVKAKETRIAGIRQQLEDANNTLSLYHIYHQLYDEYKSYKYDSAHIYAQKSLETAIGLKKKDYIIEAKCAVVSLTPSEQEAKNSMSAEDASARRTAEYPGTFFIIPPPLFPRLNLDTAPYSRSYMMAEVRLYKYRTQAVKDIPHSL